MHPDRRQRKPSHSPSNGWSIPPSNEICGKIIDDTGRAVCRSVACRLWFHAGFRKAIGLADWLALRCPLFSRMNGHRPTTSPESYLSGTTGNRSKRTLSLRSVRTQRLRRLRVVAASITAASLRCNLLPSKPNERTHFPVISHSSQPHLRYNRLLVIQEESRRSRRLRKRPEKGPCRR